MANNKQTANEISQDDTKVIQAQTRLLKAYSRLRRKGGFRALADEIGVPNVSYVFEFVKHGKLPSNPEIRERLLHPRRTTKEARSMNMLQRSLYDTMRFYHVGEQKAIKKRELLRELYGPEAAADESYNNPYDRQLRSMIEDLNNEYDALICSSPKVGYFWAGNLSEGLRAVNADSRRWLTQKRNADKLKMNLQRNLGGQLTMEM